MIEIKPPKEFSSFYYRQDGVISSCEHYHHCTDSLYTGRCREDCFKIYRKMMANRQKERE